jgi:hypothetical protein
MFTVIQKLFSYCGFFVAPPFWCRTPNPQRQVLQTSPISAMDADDIFRHASIAIAMHQQYQMMRDKHEEEEMDAVAICVLNDEWLYKIRQRTPKKYYERLDWQQAEDDFTDAQFSTRYRMSKATFHRLLNLIRPKLVVDEQQSRNSTSGGNVIRPEHCLHCLLRYLAGGDICKILESSFTCVI